MKTAEKNFKEKWRIRKGKKVVDPLAGGWWKGGRNGGKPAWLKPHPARRRREGGRAGGRACRITPDLSREGKSKESWQ